MRRYWVPQNSLTSNKVTLDREVFHHVCHVCRMGVGDRFEVLTDDGSAYLVELTEVGKKSAAANVLEVRKIAPMRRPFIHLQLSVPRFQVLESVVEKMVEMGVSSVTPLFSDFSFVRSNDAALFNKKLGRWQKIVLSATQQCGRGELMRIEKPRPLSEALAEWPRANSLGLFAYEGAEVTGIKAYLREKKKCEFADIYLFVGSEGGFSDKEARLFSARGLAPVTLGEQILRVETACVALVGILKYEFGLMGDEMEGSR